METLTSKEQSKTSTVTPRDVNTFIFKQDFKTVWPFKIGDELVPVTGCGSAFYITHYFRKQLKIRPHGKWTCYSPVCLLSGVMIDMSHKFIFNPLITKKSDCPPCVTTSAALLQVVLGVAYPLILAPVVTLYVADKFLTYPVPSISRAPWEVYRLWIKLLQKNKKAFAISAGIQVVTAAYFTWQKQICMDNLYREQFL